MASFRDFYCQPLVIPPSVHITTATCLLVCSVLNVINFAQWKQPNATVILFMAASVFEVLLEALVITSSTLIITVSSYVPIMTIIRLGLIVDIAWTWTLVLLALFRFQAVRLGRQATEQSDSAWSACRGRVGVAVISTAAVVIVLPLLILVRPPGLAGFVYKLLVMWVFRVIVPGAVMLGMGVALLVARRETPTQVGEELGMVGAHAGGPENGGEEETSAEEERQRTTAVVVIVLVLGAVKFVIGVLSLVEKTADVACSYRQAVQALDLVAFLSNVVPFVTFVCVLAEYRAVFRTCCR